MTTADPPVVPVDGTGTGLAERLRGVESVLVALDFDGTLAPIADDPDAVRIDPDCRGAVEALAAHPDASVAVVSGRELADLRSRVGIDGIAYAGNHGLELDRGDGVVHPAGTEGRSAVLDAVEALRDRVGDVPGCTIEDKTLTATVHYRRTPPDRVDEVREAVAAVAADGRDDLRVTEGKDVLEIRPAVEWDKGAALRALRDRVGGDRVPIYLGDDVTDEDAFRAVGDGGVGVLVGTRTDTRAGYRLRSRADVAPLLEWLATAVLDRPA